MSRADHVYVWRGVYAHHGIDLGDGTVIHFSGAPLNKCAAEVRRSTMNEFLRGGRLEVRRYAEGVDAEATVGRAVSRLGETGYDLLFNNCEHFAFWCVTGAHQSAQVSAVAVSTGVVGGSSALVAGSMGVVAAGGEVVGLSGSGIMSGLASVGGSAVAGIGRLSVLPTALSIGVMQVALRDRAIDPDHERHARAVARTATVIGGVGGLYLSSQVLATMGTVYGLSAAGITSGLAAAGGQVGRGMAAGTAILAALPALLAALVGYVTYRSVRHVASRGHVSRARVAFAN